MILIRDPSSHGGTRLPDFLVGCAEVQRAQTPAGDVIFAGDPLLLAIPAHLDWVPIDDGFEIARSGEMDHLRYLRRRTDIEKIQVKDLHNRDWYAPMVLSESGAIALSLPWGKIDGVRVRKPTMEQQRIITASEASRKEIVGNTLHTVPIDIIAEWVHALLASTYHLSSACFDALEVMDDTLAANVLLAAAGYPRPIAEAAYVPV